MNRSGLSSDGGRAQEWETGNEESHPCSPFSGYPFLEMRFRTKFEKINWGILVVAALNTAFELRSRYDSTTFKAFFVSCWFLLIPLYVYAWLFPRLELDAFHLRTRGLFRTREVSLAEITRVKSLGFSTDRVQIDFKPPRSLAEAKSIVVNPADRTDFISAMREFAPQATFE